MQIELIEKVKLALSKALNSKSLENIYPETRLREDLGLDSMSSLTFLMALEESIDGFVVDPDTLDMSDLECVKTIMGYVKRQLVKN